eukprot:7365780-Prorocentrum_lima.AAC.1
MAVEEELPQPPTQHVWPQHPLQGECDDVDIRSDTPTEVADSSPSPIVQAQSVDPAIALQQ